jgi:hypothetical protein
MSAATNAGMMIATRDCSERKVPTLWIVFGHVAVDQPEPVDHKRKERVGVKVGIRLFFEERDEERDDRQTF